MFILARMRLLFIGVRKLPCNTVNDNCALGHQIFGFSDNTYVIFFVHTKEKANLPHENKSRKESQLPSLPLSCLSYLTSWSLELFMFFSIMLHLTCTTAISMPGKYIRTRSLAIPYLFIFVWVHFTILHSYVHTSCRIGIGFDDGCLHPESGRIKYILLSKNIDKYCAN